MLLPPTSAQQQQSQQMRQYPGHKAVPRLQLQPAIQQQQQHAAAGRSLPPPAFKGSSKQTTPRFSLPPAPSAASKPLQQPQLYSLGSSKQLTGPAAAHKLQPSVSKRAAGKGTAPPPPAPGGNRGMVPHLQLSGNGTPRAAAAAAAAALLAPTSSIVTRSKATSLPPGVAAGGGGPGAAVSPRMADAAPARAPNSSSVAADEDMPDADGVLTARRRKRLASGKLSGSPSPGRGGSRREMELDDSLPQARGSSVAVTQEAAARPRRTPAGSLASQQQQQQQQQRVGGCMDVDGPAAASSGASKLQELTGGAGQLPQWRDHNARDAGKWGISAAAATAGGSTGARNGGGGYGAGSSHAGGSFGVSAMGTGSWGDDAAAGAACGMGGGGARAILAAGLPTFDDALSGLQASTCGAQAPLCSIAAGLAGGGFKARASMDMRPGGGGGGGAAGGSRQQPPQQQAYLHQHLYY
jgi:hypothetical protein